MNKIILPIFLFLMASVGSYSQDIITFKSGEDLKVVIEVINKYEVFYRKFDNQNGPRIITPKTDILMIRYENGTKEIFSEESKPVIYTTTSTALSALFHNDLYYKGQKDANMFYKNYSGAATTTLVISLLSPLAGLIPAIACASTSPKEKNLNFPNTNLMKMPDYRNGYSQKAKKIKQGKVWTNWGIALGVNIVFYILLVD